MATIDRRRNNAPPSYIPAFSDETEPIAIDKPSTFFLQSGIVAHASGSAYYETHDTKLLVTVHGPRPSTQSFKGLATLTCSLQCAPFCPATSSVTALHQSLKRALETSILLTRYPKSDIAIYVQVLEWSSAGSILAGAIVAASTALVTANIEVCDLVAASCIPLHDGELVVAYMSQRQAVTMLSLTGSTEQQQLDALMKTAVQQADHVTRGMQKVLLQ